MKKTQSSMKKAFLPLLLMTLFCQLSIVNAQDTSTLSKHKQTTLGLYVTSQEAYHMVIANPTVVHILDVRTMEEYYYVGHAEMAVNIPVFIETYQWDSIHKDLSMKANPDFLAKVANTFGKNDTILVTCRSGGRSAIATNMLAEAGYVHVYNITDGFEGDHVKDANSVFNGYRMVNGWKNSGIPYTNHVDPKLMMIKNAE